MKKTLRLIALLLALTLALPAVTSCGKPDYTYVEIVYKDFGSVILCLDPTYAPITVENFVSLVEDGFYDGLTMHRAVKDFMIQGGSPNGAGNGNSATAIKGEFAANGVKNYLTHERGVISMARNSASMDSATCQFFICTATNETVHRSLDGLYASFGWVVSGMSVVDAIASYMLLYTDASQSDTITDNSKQPVIQSIRVVPEPACGSTPEGAAQN